MTTISIPPSRVTISEQTRVALVEKAARRMCDADGNVPEALACRGEPLRMGSVYGYLVDGHVPAWRLYTTLASAAVDELFATYTAVPDP